jgi:triosephosphate isomerase
MNEHTVPYPHFEINFKLYPGTGGADGLEFARMVERVERETGATFVLTPQLPDVRLIARETDLAVTAPAVHGVEAGRGMGRVLPETIREAGAAGAVINHAENRDTLADIDRKIERCREVGMDAIVCVDSVEMGRAVAQLSPHALVFEKPDDIATDRAITQTHPDRVRAFVAAIDEIDPDVRVVVGGGISTAEDVRLAFEQGADATGAASAVSLAEDPEALLREIGEVVE